MTAGRQSHLSRLAQRSTRTDFGVRPRSPALFEPVPAALAESRATAEAPPPPTPGLGVGTRGQTRPVGQTSKSATALGAAAVPPPPEPKPTGRPMTLAAERAAADHQPDPPDRAPAPGAAEPSREGVKPGPALPSPAATSPTRVAADDGSEASEQVRAPAHASRRLRATVEAAADAPAVEVATPLPHVQVASVRPGLNAPDPPAQVRTEPRLYPPSAAAADHAADPPVTVTIGRIEVVTPPPDKPVPVRRPPAKPATAPKLADYLRERRGRP